MMCPDLSPRSAPAQAPASGDLCAVTVVVAAYNTGETLHELVRSLDGQSMPQEHFEVVVVDDGSTDGTGEVLDALAAQRPNWVVRHIPNSGWPGTPRNVGLELATGEYVTFVDHDDFLGRDGLATACAFARQHHSDVVVAREVGVGRSIGRFMFTRNEPDATFENSPIVRLLTPHKLYRREMLRENGIRFPEGKVRLEDHLFTMAAYFAAERISIYADHPFYYWTRREGTAHASLDLKDPHEYVEVALNRVLDLVEEHVPPGPRRDRIKAHWLERKLLPIVARAPMLEYPLEYRAEMVRAARALVDQRYAPDADRELHFSARVRVHLLRAGATEALMALARTEQAITTRAVAEQVTWGQEGVEIGLRVELLHRDGQQVEFAEEGGRLRWVPRESLDDPSLDLDVTDEVQRASVLLVVGRRDGDDDFAVTVPGGVVTGEAGAGGRRRLVFTGVAHVPLDRMLRLAGSRGRAVLDVRTETEVLGWRSLRRVEAGDAEVSAMSPPVAAAGLTAYRTTKGNLSLRRDAPAKGEGEPRSRASWGRRVARRAVRVARSVRRGCGRR